MNTFYKSSNSALHMFQTSAQLCSIGGWNVPGFVQMATHLFSELAHFLADAGRLLYTSLFEFRIRKQNDHLRSSDLLANGLGALLSSKSGEASRILYRCVLLGCHVHCSWGLVVVSRQSVMGHPREGKLRVREWEHGNDIDSGPRHCRREIA